MPTKMRAGLNEKHEPARLALLLETASLRPPNQKRSDLFNPCSISTRAEAARAYVLACAPCSPFSPPPAFRKFLICLYRRKAAAKVSRSALVKRKVISY